MAKSQVIYNLIIVSNSSRFLKLYFFHRLLFKRLGSEINFDKKKNLLTYIQTIVILVFFFWNEYTQVHI